MVNTLCHDFSYMMDHLSMIKSFKKKLPFKKFENDPNSSSESFGKIRTASFLRCSWDSLFGKEEAIPSGYKSLDFYASITACDLMVEITFMNLNTICSSCHGALSWEKFVEDSTKTLFSHQYFEEIAMAIASAGLRLSGL